MKIVNYIIELFKEIEKVTARVTSLKSAAQKIEEKLMAYYTGANSKPVYSIATILDPRIKLKFFKNHVGLRRIEIYIVFILNSLYFLILVGRESNSTAIQS